VITGQGTLTPQTATTDADGQAASLLTLGTTAGGGRGQARAGGGGVGVSPAAVPGGARGPPVAGVGGRRSGGPGGVRPPPPVVRLENQFGAPVAGEALTATIIQGTGELITAQTSSTTAVSTQSNAQGEAAFRLRAGAQAEDIVVEVAAPALPD